MLKNYINIAFRNLSRNKGFSILNILGLSVGIACCLLLFFYVRNELSYDSFHEKGDRVYRIGKVRVSDGNETRTARSQVPMGPAIEQNFPGVEKAVRFWRAFEPVVGRENQYFNESNFYFTDPSVLEVFSFNLIEGNAAKALSQPHSVVLTGQTAKKYFGDENPVGKVISYDGYPAGEVDLTVTGVIEDLPSNTQFEFDFLATLKGVETEKDNWGSHKPIWTYVLLEDNTDPGLLQQSLPSFQENQYASSAVTEAVLLEPLTSIHLYSDLRGGFKPGSSITHIYFFSTIGFFILLIACINFMNLSTAQALRRAAEVGVRKTLGAQRNELVKQFLGEAFVVTAISLLLGLLWAEIALPFFNEIAEKELVLDFTNPAAIGSLVLLLLTVGILAGLYPAFFLSKFKPVDVLGKRITSAKGGMLRKGLVVFQFTVSIVLIAVTLMIYRQMEYIRNKNIGFNEEQVVVLPYSSQERPLLNRLIRNPNVLNVSVSQRVPANTINDDGRTVTLPKKENPIRVESYVIDERFLDTYRINVIAGRGLSRDLSSDSSAFLINETAVKEFGWNSPAEAIGKSLTWSGYKSGTITGVVNDFQLASLHQKIEPLVLHTMRDSGWWKTFISVRIKPDHIPETLNFIEAGWKELTPKGAYEYFFIDQSLEQLHRADQQTGTLFGYFAGLAIFITCLGLLGLASFMAAKREKEIGVRKVFGAEIRDIISLMLKDFIVLILTGFFISVPIAYIIMNKWLNSFAYHIDIEIFIFAVAGSLALFIALSTVSYQAVRAALLDPVESLRSE